MKNLSITGILVKTYMTISLVWAKADTTYHKMKANTNRTKAATMAAKTATV